MNPVLISAVIILLAIGALSTVWYHNSPQVSAHEFIERAAASESSTLQHDSGVMCQRIRIRTPREVLERTVYLDLQRRRRPRMDQGSKAGTRLSNELAGAGVSWENPLSAGSFVEWHEREAVRSDDVARIGNDLLTLTTSVASGAIISESITVRRTDFHTVARSIQFREEGKIEIAELDYALLGWNASTETMFEPVSSNPLTANSPSAASLPLIHLSSEELDEAELQARLALSRIDADSSEPLEFSRSDNAVQISGVVATDERKNQLLGQLRLLPHVITSIFSVDELNAHRSPQNSGAGATQVYSSIGGPSPLSSLFVQQARSQRDAGLVSQILLDSTLSAQRESSALTELVQRFSDNGRLSESAQDALTTLLTFHLNKLDNALHTEEQVVNSLQILGDSSPDSTATSDIAKPQTLTVAAARNRELCSELVSGSESSTRSAQAIVADILRSIEDVRQTAKNARTSVASNTIRGPSRER